MPRSRTSLFADVIIPLAVPEHYTYSVPGALSDTIRPGCRVEVQFGKQKLYAGIVGVLHNNAPSAYKVKPIVSLLDEEPVVNDKQLAFWQWMSSYYMAAPGEVMSAALPAGLRLSGEMRVVLNPSFREADTLLAQDGGMGKDHQLIIEALHHRQALSIPEMRDLLSKKTIYPLVRTLLDKKIIFVEEELRTGYRPRTVTCVRLAEAYRGDQELKKLFGSLEKTPRRLDLLMGYIRLARAGKPVRAAGLLKSVSVSDSVLKGMADKGIFELFEEPESRLEVGHEDKDSRFELTGMQKEALDGIKKQFDGKDVVLLHGVTSSGKTNIYIKLMEETIAAGKQALYLLPEIALTTQIIARLQRHFGDQVGVYHSRFSNNERVEIWDKVRKGGYSVILGARSAVFLPFSRLGLVIVDEEHDSSFKQFDPAPRYHARDSALYLARLHGAGTLLGTATPSLESYYNAVNGKYGMVRLPERFGGMQMPDILVADRREKSKPPSEGMFTPLLMKNMHRALDAGKQAILFQNRRGYSPFVECKACGWTPACRNCDVSMTYHKRTESLRCHYCGYTVKLYPACLACGTTPLSNMGFGTEKIAEDLGKMLQGVRVERMDWDTTRTKHAHRRIIEDFSAGKIRVLVGTQMVTKGLDFDSVAVVGILSAENLMYHPDFRATEKAFQLMSQVGGRSGRKGERGIVIIQTYNPGHKLIELVKQHDWDGFYEQELKQRKEFRYPPFFKLIRISLRHPNKDKIDRAAPVLAAALKKSVSCELLGPEYGAIPRLRQKYHKHILLKIDPKRVSLSGLKEKIAGAVARFHADRYCAPVSVHYDVDPMS